MLNTGSSLLSHQQIPPVPEEVYPSWIKLHKLEDLSNFFSIINFQSWRVFHLAAPSLGNGSRGHIKGPQRKSNRRSGQPNLDKPARLIIRLDLDLVLILFVKLNKNENNYWDGNAVLPTGSNRDLIFTTPTLPFLAVQNSSIGDLVTHSLRVLLLLTYKERP